MDSFGYQFSLQTYKRFVVKLALSEEGKEIEEPSDQYMYDLMKKLGIRKRKIRSCPSVDALRQSKANELYLGDYFDKLESVINTYRIKPNNMYDFFLFISFLYFSLSLQLEC